MTTDAVHRVIQDVNLGLPQAIMFRAPGGQIMTAPYHAFRLRFLGKQLCLVFTSMLGEIVLPLMSWINIKQLRRRSEREKATAGEPAVTKLDITLVKRYDDWLAYETGNAGAWECGQTPVEAVGKLTIQLATADFTGGASKGEDGIVTIRTR